MQGTKRNVTVLLGVFLALVVSALPARADDEPVGIKAAHRVIKAQGKVVLGFAYPTAKRLTGVEYDEGSKFGDGSYQLTYTLNYVDSDGDSAYATLKFNFAKDGKLASIKDKAHSSFFPPSSPPSCFWKWPRQPSGAIRS